MDASPSAIRTGCGRPVASRSPTRRALRRLRSPCEIESGQAAVEWVGPDAARRPDGRGVRGRGAGRGRQVLRRLPHPPDRVRRARRRLPRRRRRARRGLRRPDREPRAGARARASCTSRGSASCRWTTAAAATPTARTRPTTRTSTRTAPPRAPGPPCSRAWCGGAGGPTSSTGSTTRTRTAPGRARTGSGRAAALLQAGGLVLRGTTAYPGFHKDDWEGYQVRIDADGRAWARATAHGHYQGCKQRLCHNRWIGRRAGPGSRAGATPGTSRCGSRGRAPRRPDRVRPAPSPGSCRCSRGRPARAHLERGGPAAGAARVAAPGRLPPAGLRGHAAVEEGGVPGARERQVVNARSPTEPPVAGAIS